MSDFISSKNNESLFYSALTPRAKQIFINILKENVNFLIDKKNKKILLQYLKSHEMRNEFEKMTPSIIDSFQVWIFYIGYLDLHMPNEKAKILYDVMSYFIFPRIDKNVTLQSKQ